MATVAIRNGIDIATLVGTGEDILGVEGGAANERKLVGLLVWLEGVISRVALEGQFGTDHETHISRWSGGRC